MTVNIGSLLFPSIPAAKGYIMAVSDLSSRKNLGVYQF